MDIQLHCMGAVDEYLWHTLKATNVPQISIHGAHTSLLHAETLEETIESGPLCITDLFQNKISL